MSENDRQEVGKLTNEIKREREKSRLVAAYRAYVNHLVPPLNHQFHLAQLENSALREQVSRLRDQNAQLLAIHSRFHVKASMKLHSFAKRVPIFGSLSAAMVHALKQVRQAMGKRKHPIAQAPSVPVAAASAPFSIDFPLLLSWERRIDGSLKQEKWPAEAWLRTDGACEVSIVILNLNKPDMTLRCVSELLKHTRGHTYEIIVVDNGSRPHEFVALKRSLPAYVRMVGVKTNRFFGEGNNIGAEEAKGRWICFLNNDAFVMPNWLEPLIGKLKSDSGIGAVGPAFFYPDGRVQEAGGLINPDGTVTQLGKFASELAPELRVARSVDYVSAACVILAKSDFERIGGFDLCFEPAYYEDVDLCFKIMRQLGKRIYCVPDSCVVHLENATSSDNSNNMGLHNIVEVHKKIFINRWLVGEDDGSLSDLGETPRKFKIRPALSRRRVGFYTPYHLSTGGGERYFLTWAAFWAQDNEVYLITDAPYSRFRLTQLERYLDLPLGAIRNVTLQAAARLNLDVFVALGNELQPPVPAMGRELNIYQNQFPFPIGDEQLMARDGNLDNYDHVLCYTDFVKGWFGDRASAMNVATPPISVVYPPCELPADFVRADRAEENSSRTIKIVNVGRFFRSGHCKNQHLLVEAFRQLQAKAPPSLRDRLELVLIGHVHPTEQGRSYFQEVAGLTTGLSVRICLNSSHSELMHELSTADFYWHGTGMGVDLEAEPEKQEHFGISVVEGMLAGAVPFAFDAAGPKEILTGKLAQGLYKSLEDLSSQTLALAMAPDETRALSALARERGQEFSLNKFFNSLNLHFALKSPKDVPEPGVESYLDVDSLRMKDNQDVGSAYLGEQ